MKLFTGTANPFGGLSNELDLVRDIPTKFRPYDNPWSNAAMELFYRGGSIKDWKWKSGDTHVRARQFTCFRAALSSWSTKHEDKASLTGWMLSEMLTEVPKWQPIAGNPEEM